MFKIYKVELERQLEKNIKVVRSDKGGEHYGRFDEEERHAGSFVRCLQDHGIVTQYTTLGIPQHNCG